MSANSTIRFNKPVVPIVACLMPEFGIGFQGKLPWRLKKEMKYFKDVTTITNDKNKKNAVVMGRKTWLSIPSKFRPLPDRLNVILSRSNPEWEIGTKEGEENVVMANSIESALQRLDTDFDDIERIYIIGGGEVYNSSYQYCSHLLVTEINTNKALQMDTFLNTEKIYQLFRKASDFDDWKQFVFDTGYTENKVIEGDYSYSYQLYKRK
ncbi:hypothetical protein QEN19_001522 [Hanseniaspora menglaensis]